MICKNDENGTGKQTKGYVSLGWRHGFTKEQNPDEERHVEMNSFMESVLIGNDGCNPVNDKRKQSKLMYE